MVYNGSWGKSDRWIFQKIRNKGVEGKGNIGAAFET